MKTESELLFERYCAELGVRCEPIARKPNRTPDYDVFWGEHQVVVEIKQVEPSRDDDIELAKLEAGKPASFGGEAGKRVRQEITDAKKQLSARPKGRFPALLVLYNTAPLIHYLDPMFVLLAMYGELVAQLSIPGDGGPPSFERLVFGGKQMVSAAHNTTISAVCVLIANPEGQLTLTFYHNRFAAIPFDPDWFRGDRVRHYVVPDSGARAFTEWTPA